METVLSPTVKIQHVNSFPRARKEWQKLSKEEKLQVLEGMDLGLSESWILSLIEDVLDIRKEQAKLW